MEEYPFKVNNEDSIGFNLDFEQLFAHKKGSEERFFYSQLFLHHVWVERPWERVFYRL